MSIDFFNKMFEWIWRFSMKWFFISLIKARIGKIISEFFSSTRRVKMWREFVKNISPNGETIFLYSIKKDSNLKNYSNKKRRIDIVFLFISIEICFWNNRMNINKWKTNSHSFDFFLVINNNEDEDKEEFFHFFPNQFFWNKYFQLICYNLISNTRIGHIYSIIYYQFQVECDQSGEYKVMYQLFRGNTSFEEFENVPWISSVQVV